MSLKALITLEKPHNPKNSSSIYNRAQFLLCTCHSQVTPSLDRTTPIGSIINSYLKSSQNLSDQAIHLLFAANRWELADSIKANIEKGITIVCDRYSYSGVAYSYAKGLDLEWCISPDRALPEPDIVFYLNLSVEEISKRSSFGEEKYEKIEFQKKVEYAYNKIRGKNWEILDGS